MKKSISIWIYEGLRGADRLNALSYCIQEGSSDEKADSLSSALQAAFFWQHTPEGFAYWQRIYREVLSREQIPAVLQYTGHPIIGLIYQN